MNELSFLLPHFLKEGRGRLDVYFTRVYNPVWTNPDGFSWIEVLTNPDLVGLHVALTPTWNETAYFADYVLPMGHSSERHDTHSFETHDAQWIGFRQPVLRAFRERMGQRVTDTREVNPGEVWEENEFWMDLTWRIDPDGALGIRQYVESKKRPGEKLTVDEYYAYSFEHSVPGLPQRAAAESLSPLDYMRRYGAYEVGRNIGPVYTREVPRDDLQDIREDQFGRVYTKAPKPPSPNIVPHPSPEPDAEGRRPAGVKVDGKIVRGWPTPSGLLEFYSRTLAEWGWPEVAVPAYMKSHVHPDNLAPDQMPLISTFRLPVHVHTRSANAKWLDEVAHTNPLWVHTTDANRMGLSTGDLVRVETEIGYFVVKAFVPGWSPVVTTWAGGNSVTKANGSSWQPSTWITAARPGDSSAAAGSSHTHHPIPTPSESGGPMSAYIKTSRFRSIPIRSRGSTAGTRPCASGRRNPGTRMGISAWIPTRRVMSTGGGSRRHVARILTRPRVPVGRSGCSGL
jgi:anaerobic selenocysteine-containing dehydrogenase